MKTMSKLLILAALASSLAATASHAQSVLLAGFDGNQTYIPGGVFQSEGDKFITGPVQSTAAANAGFTAELYMFNDVAKEMQWGGAGQSSSGAWGSGAQGPFTPAPSTANGTNIYTVTIASTLEFRVSNTGDQEITLETIHFAAQPGNSGVSQMTVAYASGDLTATGSGSTAVTLTTTSNRGYDADLSSILSDNTLGPGESAVFTLVTAAGSDRFRVDDVAISGTIVSEPAGPVDAGTSTVVASPTTVLADGSSTSTITVTLKDNSGNLVTGENVTLNNTSGPGTPTISPSATQTTDGNGVATFTVSSGTVGTEVFTATSATDIVTVTQTASVEFQATTVDAGNSTVVASPTVVTADDTETSTITVTLRNSSGTALPGKAVSLSGDGSATITPAGTGTDTTNANGEATFTVKSGVVGLETFTASSESVTLTGTAAVDFQAVVVAGPVDAANSTVVASPASVPADGSSISTITVTLKDSNGLVVENEGVTLENTSGPGSPTINPIDIQSTDANGQATFTVSSSTVGTEVFTATAVTDSVIITQTVGVTFTEVPQPLLSVLLDAPVSATTSDSTNAANVPYLYDTNMSLAYVGTRTLEGAVFLASSKDTDGYAGDAIKSNTFVFDMGSVVTFDGFIHAQRHESVLSTVNSIQFWVSNTDPGSDFTAIANTYFGTTPDAAKILNSGDRNLHEYVFDGAKLTGRYVIMRWISEQDSSDGNPGGYTFYLGQSANVTDYDTWAAGYPALVGLPDDDDDLDGYDNSYEWAFALDPTNPASRSWLAAPLDAANGTFSYNRRAKGLNGLTYKVWYSTDLVEWFWDAGANEVPGSAVNDVETVMVTIDPELLNEPRLFVSLSAEDMGPPPVIRSLWGANTAITINYSEAMGSSATDPANYTVQQDGGGTVSVTEASLSGDGKTVTLTLDSALSIGSSFTVTTNRIANATGQPLGNGTSGQFQTWDDDPNGIKVFILAGQSNMVGYGHTETGQTGDGGIGTLRYFAQPANNPSYPEYDYTSLLDDPGQPTTSAWKTRSNVKLWWKNGASGNLDGPIYKGDLGPLTSNGQWFGPEYGFGQIIGDHYVSDDVLIIKTAWGGHTLAGDFRPPSAVAARGGDVGASYREIFDDARQILDNLGTEFPEWAGRGYQIVGFAWHQGTSDKSPIERALEYKDNLPDFISDVRAEFGKPDLPFVIATTGMNDVGPSEPYPYTGYSDVERAQLWVAGVDQPANVLSSDTRDFWEEAAVSPREQAHHWNGNARSYFRVGKALGDDMKTLLDQQSP
jgi:hypothetical protein